MPVTTSITWRDLKQQIINKQIVIRSNGAHYAGRVHSVGYKHTILAGPVTRIQLRLDTDKVIRWFLAGHVKIQKEKKP